MTFMEEIVSKNKSIWDQCIRTSFVQELMQGNLPFEKFKHYMIQDSIYLRHYAKIIGKLISLSDTFKEIESYYLILNVILGDEANFRLTCLAPYGITESEITNVEPCAENKAYTDFMYEFESTNDSIQILMSILPCMISYNYIFEKILPDAKQSDYYSFIQCYASKDMKDFCDHWCNFVDEKCKDFSDDKKQKLAYIFEKASCHELDFWKMSYKNN